MRQNTIILQPLSVQDLSVAARLCALAMRDNPLHIKVFGPAALKRQRRLTRLFTGLLPYIARKGELMGAYADGQLVGVLGRLRPGLCQPNWQDVLTLAPTLLTSNSPLGLIKTLRWLGSWARFDPAEPHWHFGPLAVVTHRQRQGIGRLLMSHAIADAAGVSLYLETDKPSNVHFYQQFGFKIAATPTLLATPTWLMQLR